MDGRLIPTEQAQVHVLTHTLHYGLGVFEGIRAYEQANGGSAIFRLDEHLDRLFGSARICNLELPYGFDTLRQATLELVAANGAPSCYIRPLAFLDEGTMGIFPRDNKVRVAIMTWLWGAYLGEEGLTRGVRCKVSSYVRPFPNSTMTRAKIAGNYVNSVLAKCEAVGLGYDEAVLLDTNGYVAECSGQNLFLVRRGTLKTPMGTSVLEGITRDSVVRIAADLGIEAQESIITRDELYVADEVFMCGTAVEVTPVREIDDRRIADGKPGPVTLAIQERFFQAVRGERPEYADWLAHVPVEARAAGRAGR
jgi:branched-chain amino acid aminotransferase